VEVDKDSLDAAYAIGARPIYLHVQGHLDFDIKFNASTGFTYLRDPGIPTLWMPNRDANERPSISTEVCSRHSGVIIAMLTGMRCCCPDPERRRG